MKQQISFAQRLKGQSQRNPVETLEVLTHRIPFYFQGLAALTGQRRQRENLACWSRWEECYYREEFGPGTPGRPVRQEKTLKDWLVWADLDLMAGEADMFIGLILEPMYSLEECRRATEQ